jgi:hypothetical protein
MAFLPAGMVIPLCFYIYHDDLFTLAYDFLYLIMIPMDGVFTIYGNGDSLRFYIYHYDLITLAYDLLYINMIPVDGIFSCGWHFYLWEW